MEGKKAPICPLCLDDDFFPPAHKSYEYECQCSCHKKNLNENDRGIPKNRG